MRIIHSIVEALQRIITLPFRLVKKILPGGRRH